MFEVRLGTTDKNVQLVLRKRIDDLVTLQILSHDQDGEHIEWEATCTAQQLIGAIKAVMDNA